MELKENTKENCLKLIKERQGLKVVKLSDLFKTIQLNGKARLKDLAK